MTTRTPSGDESEVDDPHEATELGRTSPEPRDHAAAKAPGREIVLLDIGLRDFDGYELVERLRQLPGARRAWFVARGGWNHPPEQTRSLDQGLPAHFTEPIEASAVLDLVAADALEPGEAEPEPGAE